ncbi:LysR family transcriptional regulator [Paraburkholderia bannensis]|uniref:LysR family transcriptional regulator n=1 Tax=Paraburkholderia bannensis TaxID=765414 RepID=UPI002AB18A8F|nr:LysR family transcriptional regulator [Paraburkholderia bannensis]
MDRTLHAMSVFSHVARTGSFTAAAETLGISAASASTLIRQLEGHLGVTLLQRSTRCVRTTTEGDEYQEHCERILGEIEEMAQHLNGSGRIARGRLSVDVDQEVADCILPLVPSFRSTYPEVGLRVDVGGEPEGLIANGVDCAVVVGNLSDSSLRIRRVGEFRAVTVASPAYLATVRPPVHPEDLNHLDVIHYSPRRFGPAREFRYSLNGAETRVRLCEKISVADARSAVRYAVEGVGIAQVCERMVAEHLATGQLVSLLDEFVPSALPISVLYADRRQIPMSIRAFIDWIQSKLQLSTSGDDRVVSVADAPSDGKMYWGSEGRRVAMRVSPRPMERVSVFAANA